MRAVPRVKASSYIKAKTQVMAVNGRNIINNREATTEPHVTPLKAYEGYSKKALAD